VFLYQALETRPAQETLIDCEGLRKIKKEVEGIKNSACIK
jgi:hypothetical protein